MIDARGIKRIFKNGNIETSVLKGIDVRIADGEFVAIMGRSGAGKSTLLYQLSLLDEPTEGIVAINGLDTSTLSQFQKTTYRLQNMGFVFQDYALIPELTAVENVMLPLLMQGVPTQKAFTRAKEKLAIFNLEDRLDNVPSQLSGGEQQRVSIARAIVHEPHVLFADEPTANLDLQAALDVIAILESLAREHKQTIVMVTHELEYGRRADRIIHLADGLIDSIEKPKHKKH